MDKPFWAIFLLLSCSYTAAVADDPTSESKGWGDVAPAPSENECRSFIEAALKEQRTQVEAAPDVDDQTEDGGTSSEGEIDKTDQVTEEAADDASSAEDLEKREIDETDTEDGNINADDSVQEAVDTDATEQEDGNTESAEVVDSNDGEAPTESESNEEAEKSEQTQGEIDASDEKHEASDEIDTSGEKEPVDEDSAGEEDKSVEAGVEVDAADSSETQEVKDVETEGESKEDTSSAEGAEEAIVEGEETSVEDNDEVENHPEQTSQEQEQEQSSAESTEAATESDDTNEDVENKDETSAEEAEEKASTADDTSESKEEETAESNEGNEQSEEQEQLEKEEANEEVDEISGESVENQEAAVDPETINTSSEDVEEETKENLSAESSSNEENQAESPTEETLTNSPENAPEEDASQSQEQPDATTHETEQPKETEGEASSIEEEAVTAEDVAAVEGEAAAAEEAEEEAESPEQEDLTLKIEIPENLRPRNHIFEVLRLDSESVDVENKLLKAEESTLKDLKRLYEAAIKPLEILYKYRDLSNRHFGDPEIFSKPLILFMGPWSGGKSTIINYLLDNEYRETALRTGAEPSPAYFNIVMWGEREEVMDGTQLAADWTFSGLQKFGQGLLDRLRGLKMNHPLLEKVNIVEIPGILEIRKQVERLFPLNDACQWFIDRADIIFLVYDPSKLDVGPETEAILDQLKGREYQTKIILNKADQVKPEELMRVQGTLIWNISPLMSSTEPPVMYSTSLWSHPYQAGSPSRLLFAQEKAFLKDLREAVDKRVENKISSARRFAVRVRNHAKMVDCYLTTFYNHKSFFGNKQTVSNDIIEHPQNYHIYEGLSTLTNISRYDLPDPDVYRDFFRLNPVYDFQQLSSTCTYFRGCPINRLDVAIAYDLPELVGKYKKIAEDIIKSPKSGGKK